MKCVPGWRCRLLEKLIDRLPAAAVVIGDANFGVFSVAWIAQQRSHPVLLRMTESRARRLAGEPLREGTDRHLTWKPSPDESSEPSRIIRRRLCAGTVDRNQGPAQQWV